MTRAAVRELRKMVEAVEPLYDVLRLSWVRFEGWLSWCSTWPYHVPSGYGWLRHASVAKRGQKR